MRKILIVFAFIGSFNFSFSQQSPESFPDGTLVGDWFKNYKKLQLKDLGKQYCITDFSVKHDSTIVQTRTIQAVIDRAFENGGGVIVIPKGVFLSGALFF